MSSTERFDQRLCQISALFNRMLKLLDSKSRGLILNTLFYPLLMNYSHYVTPVTSMT